MARARRAGRRRKGPILLTTLVAGAVLVAGAAVVGGAVALGNLDLDDSAGSPPATPTSTSQASPPEPTTDGKNGVAAPSADVDACEAEVDAAETVVQAAEVAAGHWEEHVQARTDLLAGKNTEAETRAIWKRTRLAGPDDFKRLSEAVTAHAPTRGSCAKLTGSVAANCKQRIAALDEAMRTGRGASGDWNAHLDAMAAHAAGDFGAEHAQDLWVQAWQAAPKNLNAFAKARDALAKAPACNPA